MFTGSCCHCRFDELREQRLKLATNPQQPQLRMPTAAAFPFACGNPPRSSPQQRKELRRNFDRESLFNRPVPLYFVPPDPEASARANRKQQQQRRRQQVQQATQTQNAAVTSTAS